MKKLYLITLLFALGCGKKTENNESTSSQTPPAGNSTVAAAGDVMSLMRSILQKKYKEGSYEETIGGNSMTFKDKTTNGVDRYSTASYRKKGNLLIVKIFDQDDMDTDVNTAIFVSENGTWKSILQVDFIPGFIDTLLDLDGDRRDELIMEEYKSQSAGANSIFTLYALVPGNMYDKNQAFASSSEGYSIYNFDEKNRQLQSSITYVPSGNRILIHVEEHQQWTANTENQEFGSKDQAYDYAWDGEKLNRTGVVPAILFIHGKEIWVRDSPTTGKVVMKLDDGDRCKILEKGKAETIRGTTDYWYKIEYTGKQGWVFGSQTSVKAK